ncbi:MAG: YciI family protein [Woeseiaceae bacterium]|nr:YciI family protein [Woeseiaceae bacterium]
MRIGLSLVLTVLLIVGHIGSCAVAQEASTADANLSLFAVEIKIGPNWDAAKAPSDQAFFKEHSANLKRLRDEGHIVMGARYSDIGLIIIAAATKEAVRTMMDQDPSMSAGTFVFEVHAFNVFYPGLVQAQ